MAEAIAASGTELVTVALRRIDPAARGSLIDVLDDAGVQLLPNTAGCYTARDAVLTAQARARGVRDRLGQARGDRRRPHAAARRARAARGGGEARRRRLRRAALHERRPDPRAPAGGRRLRRGDAARLADRLRHGDQQRVQPARSSASSARRAGDPRRGRRHGVRRGARDGARLRRGAVRERDLACRGPGRDGAGDPAGRRGRAACARRRADPAPAARGGVHARATGSPSSEAVDGRRRCSTAGRRPGRAATRRRSRRSATPTSTTRTRCSTSRSSAPTRSRARAAQTVGGVPRRAAGAAGERLTDGRTLGAPAKLAGTHREPLDGLPATSRFVVIHCVFYCELRAGSCCACARSSTSTTPRCSSACCPDPGRSARRRC